MNMHNRERRSFSPENNSGDVFKDLKKVFGDIFREFPEELRKEKLSHLETRAQNPGFSDVVFIVEGFVSEDLFDVLKDLPQYIVKGMIKSLDAMLEQSEDESDSEIVKLEQNIEKLKTVLS